MSMDSVFQFQFACEPKPNWSFYNQFLVLREFSVCDFQYIGPFAKRMAYSDKIICKIDFPIVQFPICSVYANYGFRCLGFHKGNSDLIRSSQDRIDNELCSILSIYHRYNPRPGGLPVHINLFKSIISYTGYRFFIIKRIRMRASRISLSVHCSNGCKMLPIQ